MKVRTLIIAPSLLVVVALTILYTLYSIDRERTGALERLSTTIAENDRLLKVVTAGPLYDGNVEQLGADLDSFFLNPDMIGIELRERNGDIRITRRRAAAGRLGQTLRSRVVITRGVDELGEAATVYSTALIERRLSGSRNQLLVYAGLLMGVLTGVIYLVARGLTGPIERLTAAARAMADGDLDRQIRTSSVQELYSLGQSFVRMRDAIRAKMADLAVQNEALLRTQFSVDRAKDAIFWIRADGTITYVNEAACRSLGYTKDELLAKAVFDIAPGLSREGWAEQWDESRRRESITLQTTHRAKDGREFPVEVAVDFMSFAGEEYHFSCARDLTERRRAEEQKAQLEAQLLQAQKMESIGRLAGGVAHDFNNMLGVILGYAALIRSRLPAEDPLAADVTDIERAAIHARDVTRQLLAFSRKQIIVPKPVNLNQLVAETQKTLSRLIGEDIELRFQPGPDLWQVKVDASQVDQILMNLAVNARDAMPDGGRLMIETANVQLDEAYCRQHVGSRPGAYVLLAVSDNGVGMDRETLAHAFEPFFTTKEFGKGTGLGLATVYGVVAQNDGFLSAYSEPGQGTTLKIYLPRLLGGAAGAGKAEETPVVLGGGSVLVVEDEVMVRRMTTAMLDALGFTVLAAGTWREAEALCTRNDTPIDLLLTDVVMPGLSGKELRDRIRRIRPRIKVLFMSGYTTNVIVHHGVLEEGVHFIHKPFGMNDLARAVRDAMGGG